MAAKPTLKAIAAARAMQAPLDYVAAPLAKPKRRQKITDDMSGAVLSRGLVLS